MHGVYDSHGPDGFWEHGHPPCPTCLEYHEHIKREIAKARREAELATEAWKPINNFLGYAVSTLGRVRSTRLHNGNTGARYLSPCVANKRGHLTVSLRRDGQSHNCWVHRLVLFAFVGLPDVTQQCRHLDGDSSNNFLSNLCWGTAKENAEDMVKHGTIAHGERQGNSILTEAVVIEAKKRVAAGEAISAVAKSYGVARTTVSDIINGKNWKHIADPLQGDV